MSLPPIPEDVLHVEHLFLCDGSPASFGFWLHVHPAVLLDPTQFSLIAYDWFEFTLQTFLDCMHEGTTQIACRITRRGIEPYVHLENFAPNAGSQSGAQNLAAACGLYLPASVGGRGSGSRLRLPGLPDNFVDNDAKLSGYGVQQLVFAADALFNYPLRLSTDLELPTELVTLQTRKNGLPLAVAEYSPTLAVRPTFHLDSIGRRMRASGGFSPP